MLNFFAELLEMILGLLDLAFQCRQLFRGVVNGRFECFPFLGLFLDPFFARLFLSLDLRLCT